MASESLSCRQIILDNLHKEHTERNRIVRDCFQMNERVSKSEFGKIEVKSPSIVVGAAMTISDAFKQLYRDVSNTCELCKPGGWEKDILEDSAEVLDFQINVFFSKISALLKQLCKKYQEDGVLLLNMKTSYFGSFDHVSKYLGECEKDATQAFSKFLYTFRRQDRIQARDSVPAPTFRELLVRNESSELSENIFEAIKFMEGKEAALIKTSPIIGKSSMKMF